jgi:phosphatidylserine/phosphatidylglycerophosphate/cardiolipin synthase-like enzyme
LSDVDNPAVPVVTTGSYPARTGNRLQLLIDGVPAFRRLCEAIDQAQGSVWATVTFMWPTFEMPDGRGSALDVLEQAAQRGLDVRIIFWRPDEETASLRRNAFWGAPEHLELLKERYRHLNVRWDRAHPGYCQHQKSWLIDAGRSSSTAFVGGINLNPNSVVAPGHAGEGQNHDVYLEVCGPSVADIQHNFVQRWNEASERFASDGLCGPQGASQLAFPVTIPREDGKSLVQIQRTMHRDRCRDIALGEQTILAQYIAALRAARHAIYIENQYVEVPEIVAGLDAALRRGVQVVLLMPAVPDHAPTAYDAPDRRAFFEARAALGRFPNFTLAGIAGPASDGRRVPVYIHSKLMIVDDAWATVGSCNLHRFSLFGNGEINAATWCPEAATAMRIALFREHLDIDTSTLACRDALRVFRSVAQDNRRKLARNEWDWRGLAFTLDVATYGKQKSESTPAVS